MQWNFSQPLTNTPDDPAGWNKFRVQDDTLPLPIEWEPQAVEGGGVTGNTLVQLQYAADPADLAKWSVTEPNDPTFAGGQIETSTGLLT